MKVLTLIKCGLAAGFVLTALWVWATYYHWGDIDKIEMDLLDEEESLSIKDEVEYYHRNVSDEELLYHLLHQN